MQSNQGTAVLSEYKGTSKTGCNAKHDSNHEEPSMLYPGV
jgi:hypothetical protein